MLKELELITLDEKRAAEGKASIIEVMTKEEMVSYRENLIAWIEERENKNFTSAYMKENNKKMIDRYKAELAKIEETAKEDAIEAFLTNWKKQVKEYYMTLAKEYRAIKENKQNVIQELVEKGFSEGAANFRADDIIRKQKSQFREQLNNKDANIIGVMSERSDFENELDIMLESEAKIKYFKIMDSVEKKVGKIRSAEMYIAQNGELNGNIEGENGSCKVKTIAAGGYNKQCYHFRTIVK